MGKQDNKGLSKGGHSSGQYSVPVWPFAPPPLFLSPADPFPSLALPGLLLNHFTLTLQGGREEPK